MKLEIGMVMVGVVMVFVPFLIYCSDHNKTSAPAPSASNKEPEDSPPLVFSHEAQIIDGVAVSCTDNFNQPEPQCVVCSVTSGYMDRIRCWKVSP